MANSPFRSAGLLVSVAARADRAATRSPAEPAARIARLAAQPITPATAVAGIVADGGAMYVVTPFPNILYAPTP